jgi:hypothetical protein
VAEDDANLNSYRTVITVPCPATGETVEIPGATPMTVAKGYTFDCSSCGARHRIKTEAFGQADER